MYTTLKRAFRDSRFASTLIISMVTLSSTSAIGAQWAARHGLTSTQYQQAFTRYVNKGYRLTSVSGYVSAGKVRYAALWTKKSGPAWAARHGLTASQYQSAFTRFTKLGYRLTFVNGVGVGNKAHYAAIWQKKSGPAWAARHGLTASQYQQAVNDMSKKGYGLSHVSAFSVKGSPRFAAIFHKGGAAWAARHGLTSSAYQKAFNSFAKKGYRLKVVSGYRQGNSDRYAAIWVKKSGPQWSARHGIKSSYYQYVFDNYRYQSWQPTYIEAFNSTSGVRFNGLWQNTVFRAKDLALIHKKVRAYMKANNVPGLSIAIMKNEKLLYAAGFGYANKEKREPVGPMHRFRIASVSKPITHVATMRVIKTTNLGLNSKVFGHNSVLGGKFSTPSNNKKINNITVNHLIGHRAGFVNINKAGNKSDPMFAYSGTGHSGLIKWALGEYPLGTNPGAKYSYSNFGYSLLGRIIETKTGQAYQTYVRNKILKPAGAGRMVIGANKESQRKKDEVKYYGAGAYSSVKPVRFDSHGGWIATPVDLLRFMRHENVLGTPYAHTGAMAGTKAIYRRRSDGFGYAGVSNTSSGGTDKIDKILKEIVKGVSKWPKQNLF